MNRELLPLTPDLGRDAVREQVVKTAGIEDELQRWSTGKRRTTRKLLNEKLEESKHHLSYLENLFSRFHRFQETGQYEWTANEQDQIQKLAEALQGQQTKNLFGRTIVEESSKSFESDQVCIRSWRHPFGNQSSIASHGQQIIAEITLRGEARKEAFRLAGIEVPVLREDL